MIRERKMNCSSEISGIKQTDTDFFQVMFPHIDKQVLKTIRNIFCHSCVLFLCPFYCFFFLIQLFRNYFRLLVTFLLIVLPFFLSCLFPPFPRLLFTSPLSPFQLFYLLLCYFKILYRSL